MVSFVGTTFLRNKIALVFLLILVTAALTFIYHLSEHFGELKLETALIESPESDSVNSAAHGTTSGVIESPDKSPGESEETKDAAQGQDSNSKEGEHPNTPSTEKADAPESSDHASNPVPSAQFDVTQKILYFSRHLGTTADFKFMARTLQLENVTYMDPSAHYPFISGKGEYESIITSGFADDVCSKYNSIFISDSLADGWGFIMSNSPKCKNVVFVATNRFDVGVRNEDKNLWYEDINHALNRNDEYRARFVANNPFEVPYLKSKGIEINAEFPLIRPFGDSDVPAKDQEVDTQPCLILGVKNQEHDLLYSLIKEHVGMECARLEHYYGGPRTLSQYDSIVVHWPYQVSIMKMWENLAHGVLFAVPSPELYVSTCAEFGCSDIGFVQQAILLMGDSWPQHSDFYLPGWERCFVQFNSWEELKVILEKKDYKKSINYCRDKMMDLREEGIQAWKTLLHSMQN